MRSAGIDSLIFTGGEPSLRNDLEIILKESASKGFSLLLLSNGTLIDDSRARSLRQSGLKSITLSWNRAAEINDSTSFETQKKIIRRKIEILKNAEFDFISVIIVISRKNARFIDKIWASLADAGIGVLFQPVYVKTGYKFENNYSLRFLSPSELSSLWHQLTPWADAFNTHNYLNLLESFYSRADKKPSRCDMGVSAMVLGAAGNISPCFHRNDLQAGNIKLVSPHTWKKKIKSLSRHTSKAQCFGEHCLSLFMHI